MGELNRDEAAMMRLNAIRRKMYYDDKVRYARTIGMQDLEQYTDLESIIKAIEAFEHVNKDMVELKIRASRLNLLMPNQTAASNQINELLSDFETDFKRLSEAHYSVELEPMLLSKDNRDRFTEWVDFHLAWSQQFYLVNTELPKDWRVSLPSHQYDARELQEALERLKAQHAHWAIFKKRIFVALGFAWMLPMVYFLF